MIPPRRQQAAASQQQAAHANQAGQAAYGKARAAPRLARI